MIIVSGFNVYPNEVEDVISAHPDIIECAVIGVPSESTGETVKVFAETKNLGLTADDLKTFCRGQLTAHKVPKLFKFRDELPKSNVSKILRGELRDEDKIRENESTV